MPLLTIFTAPKPFSDPHINLIQRNAIGSWLHLGQEVEVILVGEEPGLSEAAAELGVCYLPQVKRNSQGTPLVSSIFELARQNSASPLLLYANADILFTPELIKLAQTMIDLARTFLLVGQRWDLDVQQPLDFNPGWDLKLKNEIRQRGRLHPAGGSDYFLFPRDCFSEIPDFAIGRAGWDNWMIYHARQQSWAVVDATGTLDVVHQDHDYRHLPNGQPHYRLPETDANIRLAGGRRTIFTLADATHRIEGERLVAIPLQGNKMLRELEILPQVRWRSYPLAELFYAIFHPLKAWGEWRGRLAYKLHP